MNLSTVNSWDCLKIPGLNLPKTGVTFSRLILQFLVIHGTIHALHRLIFSHYTLNLNHIENDFFLGLSLNPGEELSTSLHSKTRARCGWTKEVESRTAATTWAASHSIRTCERPSSLAFLNPLPAGHGKYHLPSSDRRSRCRAIHAQGNPPLRRSGPTLRHPQSLNHSTWRSRTLRRNRLQRRSVSESHRSHQLCELLVFIQPRETKCVSTFPSKPNHIAEGRAPSISAFNVTHYPFTHIIEYEEISRDDTTSDFLPTCFNTWTITQQMQQSFSSRTAWAALAWCHVTPESFMVT
ncbi:hypothetical protein V2J09_007435 [Rumex salicifolius]